MAERMNKERTEDRSLIRELSLLFGPTGCEREVADAMIGRIRPLCHSLRRDRMGNLIKITRCITS